MKRIWQRVKVDLKNYIWVPIVFLLYNIVVLRVFGAFCPMVIMTGFPCPGCGMTRAFLCVLTGHFADAAAYNACIYLWITAGGYFFWNRYVKGRRAKGIIRILGAIAVIMTGYYFYRMALQFPGAEPLVFYEGNVIGKIIPKYNGYIQINGAAVF